MMLPRERVSEKLLSVLQEKSIIKCKVIDGKLVRFYESKHRTRSGCRHRMFWRIKSFNMGKA